MGTATDLLDDGFGRVRDGVAAVLDGLSPDQLAWQPTGGGNPVGWLVWHLLRMQDDHVAGATGGEQVWTAGGWADRVQAGHPGAAIGYGDDAAAVAAVRATAGQLSGYAAAVAERTARVLAGLSESDLARVVDADWDPPVTMAVRLVSVLSDDLQHLGQAAYVRGLLERS